MDNKELVKRALLRRAVGYEATETVEEYAECEGEIKLVKKKISKKNVPPDVSAAKMVMEECAAPVENLTDKQLEAEKLRLLHALKDAEHAKRQ